MSDLSLFELLDQEENMFPVCARFVISARSA